MVYKTKFSLYKMDLQKHLITPNTESLERHLNFDCSNFDSDSGLKNIIVKKPKLTLS